MSNQNKKGPGGHYSGANPIPNIKKFVEGLDADKKRRDEEIERQMKEGNGQGEAVPHTPARDTGTSGTKKTVTDPVTGKQVDIEDVNDEFTKRVENPVVSSLVS
jgi:hypothetical protein